MSGAGDKIDLEITEDEAKIYDRQIRLWGLDAQKRLRSAKIVVVGFGGLGSEIAKNIILAGVKSIHFMDDQKVTEGDLRSQIFVRRTDLEANRATASIKRAQALNPMVEITAECSSIREKSLSFFSSYDVVCANNLDWDSANALDHHCRKGGIKLFLSGCFGLYGYMLSDLGSHEYALEVKIASEKQSKMTTKKPKIEDLETKIVRKVAEYCPIQEVLNFRWSKDETRNPPTGFFFCKVISEFIRKNKRTPQLECKDSDKNILEEIRREMLADLSMDGQHISMNYFEECYGEINPLCTVLGGVVAQDVLKAVSKKDQPHNNFFFFDGILSCGSVDQIRSSH